MKSKLILSFILLCSIFVYVQTKLRSTEQVKTEQVKTEQAPFNPAQTKQAQTLKAGGRLVKTVDGVEYAFRWCPAGEFDMGHIASNSQKPVHKVILTQGFWMLETEITQKMWKSVMNRSQADETKLAGLSGEYGIGDNFPIYRASYTEFEEFCEKLSKKMGVSIILPTEAQWEYACCCGTDGYSPEMRKKMGWGHENRDLGSAHPVAAKGPNKWGLYDMYGNVWEWCSDRWTNHYSDEAQTDPTGPQTGVNRVIRGGSWQGDLWFDNRSNEVPQIGNRDLGGRVIFCP